MARLLGCGQKKVNSISYSVSNREMIIANENLKYYIIKGP